MSFSMQRTASVARKETLHILRDPSTLFFAFFIPVLELFMLGYAIDTNVRFVRTVVCDFADTKDSRNLIEAFANRLQAGERLDPEAYAQEHPECGDELRRILPAMLALADLGRSAAAGPAASAARERRGRRRRRPRTASR